MVCYLLKHQGKSETSFKTVEIYTILINRPILDKSGDISISTPVRNIRTKHYNEALCTNNEWHPVFATIPGKLLENHYRVHRL